MLTIFRKPTITAVSTFIGGAALFQASQLTFFKRTMSSTSTQKALKNSDDWFSFNVGEIERINHNTRLYRFPFEDSDSVLGLQIASCILSRAEIDGENVTRPYTPTTKETQKGHFDLVVKSYPDGKMSKLFGELKVGDSMEFKGPILKFDYKENMVASVGLICGGTGITPMYQLIRKILDNPNDKTHVNLVYANQKEKDILLRSELDDLKKSHSNFDIEYVLDEAEADSDWNGSTGYITKEMVSRFIPKPSSDCQVFVCGPPPMMEAISGDKAKDKSQGELTGLLKEMNYSPDQVYKF